MHTLDACLMLSDGKGRRVLGDVDRSYMSSS